MISAKKFICDYVAFIFEAVGDIKHYPKNYTFKANAADVSEPPERQGEFLPSGKVPLFKSKASAPANTAVLGANKKAADTKVANVSSLQTATKEKGIAARTSEPEGLTLSDRAFALQTHSGNAASRSKAKRVLTRAAERAAGGPRSFERKGVMADPGKEKYLTAPQDYFDLGPSGKTTEREPDPAHPVHKNITTRSQGSGRTYIKSQSVEWKPAKPQGPHTSLVHPQNAKSISAFRVDLPAKSGPHVANAVTKALLKTTRPEAEKNLIARQAAVKKSDET